MCEHGVGTKVAPTDASSNRRYGVVRGTPFKWLDPVHLSRLLLPSACTIDRLVYFTAHVSGVTDPGAPARQHAYLSALSTLP